jgi:hypothetical protein
VIATIADGLEWVLRAFGALYLVGGLWMIRTTWFWARLSPDMQLLSRALSDFNVEFGDQPAKSERREDLGRPWWLFAGACLTAASGAAMLLAHRAAVPLLALLIVHQLLYFIRQRRRELKARNAADAAEAQPSREAVNGFFSALLMGVLAAWLGAQGELA